MSIAIPPAPKILDVYANLRSHIALHASPHIPTDGTRFITGASTNLQTLTREDLYMFLQGVGSVDKGLAEYIDNVPPNAWLNPHSAHGKLTPAWLNLLSLEAETLSSDAVWSAIRNLVAIAAGTVPQPEQQAQEATTSLTVPRTPCKHPLICEDDTPVRANSCLQFASEAQTHAEVDPFLRAELQDTILKDVKGFYNFFPGITAREWNCAARCPASCACIWRKSGNPGLPFPENTSQTSVLQWFSLFNKRLVSRKFYTSYNNPLANSLCSSDRKCDVFLAPTNPAFEISSTSARHNWVSVLVPGELKAPAFNDATPDTIMQLAGYVREVFGAQITRRLVHAFTICGSILRCYLFDRAGVSISEKIDICKNSRTQQLFIKILQCYTSMDPV